MNKTKQTRVGLVPGSNYLAAITLLAFSLGCHKPHIGNNDLKNFKEVVLVANTSEYQPKTVDPTLKNAFGIAWAGSTAWVNSVGGHVSELYNAEGDIVRHNVNIPSPETRSGGLPTGIVFSGGQGFNLRPGPALFLFSGFDGVISGWNPAFGDTAQFILHPRNAAYTGLAIGRSGGRNLIYGANFGKNRIDAWDTTFARVTLEFKDPSMPADFSPYNIQAVGDFLFVMYAQLDTSTGVPGHVAGAGKGFVSVFKTDGSFVKRFASRGTLNIPWGVTLAPGSFLEEHDMNVESKDPNSASNYGGNGNGNHDPKDPVILVGNFGDGRINVFSEDGRFLGQLQAHNHPITIEGLWALSFAPSSSNVDPNRLYFSAGPDNENDGVFGYLIKQ